MLFSLGLIIILGILLKLSFEKIKLPGLLGMLILGVIIGPYGPLPLIDEGILNISSELRKIALIVILIRAGLGIKKETLKKIGKPAMKMSCIPGLLEGFSIMFISKYLLGFTFIQGGILGFIVAAVSPAVVVPSMLHFIETGRGKDKEIPSLILAGASIDDVFAITIFSSFTGLYFGTNSNLALQILGIPVSIILGILSGALIGLIVYEIFKKFNLSDVQKILILFSISLMYNAGEEYLKGIIPIASLLGIMAIGYVISERDSKFGLEMSLGYNRIWGLAEILLFVLVGAQVNIHVAMDSGMIGILIIAFGLIFRSIGVIISLLGTNLNKHEKLFCVISYIPKATVQAAIGAVPLTMGVEGGEIILALAVLSIIITAPLGSMGIRIVGEKHLSR
ncbi:MAG: cation:proton antiporter [Firmicutes bacterium]|jgi:NhaP-type Na+/H+ or K+/H+ antiporter|nr:cation:proton antiporter [Bacillota bacterium]